MDILNGKILNDLKTAMREKNTLVLATLRMLVAALKNKSISLGGGGKTVLSDEQIIDCIKSEIKKRNDSAAAYEQGNRPDLANREKDEITVLSAYMPEQMSEAQIEKAVEDIAGAGEMDFGKLMGLVMAQLKGKADGSAVSAAVKKFLNR